MGNLVKSLAKISSVIYNKSGQVSTCRSGSIKPPPAWSVGPGRIPVEGEVGLMEIHLFELSITIAPVVALAVISLMAKMLRHNKQKR